MPVGRESAIGQYHIKTVRIGAAGGIKGSAIFPNGKMAFPMFPFHFGKVADAAIVNMCLCYVVIHTKYQNNIKGSPQNIGTCGQVGRRVRSVNTDRKFESRDLHLFHSNLLPGSGRRCNNFKLNRRFTGICEFVKTSKSTFEFSVY